jgi:MFS family permease
MSASADGQLPWRLVTTVAGANLLNPLNSSMIAVALLALGTTFGADIATATWLVSAFYIGGAIGMPLMGRLADRFGPRRIFVLGLLLVVATSVAAPFAPTLSWLILVRAALALGTSAAYPAGLAMFRSYLGRQRPPAGALGVISIASSVSAAVGPVIGGVLVALGGWQAIFLVNVPVAAVGLLLARGWLPSDPRASASAAAAALRRTNLRVLLADPQLAAICVQFAAVNVAFYAVFFGLPLWLEAARGFAADATGLLLLPVAAVGVLATPVAARLIDHSGPRLALVMGSILLISGSLLMLVFDDSSPLAVILLVGAVLGVPNAFNNLGLQAALYQAAPAAQMGSAGGLLQTFRYIGAMVATAMIGAVYGASASSDRLHLLATILALLSTALLVASLRMRNLTTKL